MVLLNKLLSSVIDSCTSAFHSCFSQNPFCFSTRLKLMATMYKTRIMIMRLLVAFRAAKNPYIKLIEEQKNEGENGKAGCLHFDYRQFLQELHQNPLPPLPHFPITKFNIENVNVKRNLRFNFAKLFEREVPKRMKSFKIKGKFIYFAVPKKYSVTIKQKAANKFVISSFTVYYPKFLTGMEAMMKKLTNLLQNYMKDPTLCLTKIDRLLHSIYIYGKMAKLMERTKHVDYNFPFTVTHRNVWMNINFAKGYGQQGRIIFSQFKGKMICSCPAPVYLPSDSTPENSKPSTIYATPHTFAEPDKTTSNMKSRMIYFRLKDKDTDKSGILFFQSVLIYTRLVNCWNALMKVITYFGASFVTPSFKWNKDAPTLSKIEVHINTFNLITVQVDTSTGGIITHFVGNRILCQNFIEWITQPSLIYNLFETIFGKVYKMTPKFSYKMTMKKKFYSGCIAFNPAAYPHFVIFYESSAGIPRLLVFDSEGRQYETPEMVELKNMNSRFSWSFIDAIYSSVSGLLFIMEVERLCNERKIRTNRSYTKLLICSRDFTSCNLSIDNNTHWKLKFSLNSALLLRNSNCTVVFTGSIKTARAPLYVMHIYNKIADMLQVVTQLSLASVKSQVITQLSLPQNQLAIFTISDGTNNTHFSVHLQNNAFISQGFSQTKAFFKMTDYAPQRTVRIQRAIELNNGLDKTDVGQYTAANFIGYISHSTIPLVHLSMFCSRTEWEMVNWRSPTGFQLIYRRKYTIDVELRPIHVYSIGFSSNLPNTIMVIPLVDIKAINATLVKGAFRMKYQATKMEEVLTAAGNFVDKYEDALSAGFGNTVFHSKVPPSLTLFKDNAKFVMESNKTTLISSDSSVNEAFSRMPDDWANTKLMLNLVSHSALFTTTMLMITLHELDPMKEIEAAQSFFIDGNSCIVTVNNKQVEIGPTTITVNNQVMQIGGQMHIANIISNLLSIY